MYLLSPSAPTKEVYVPLPWGPQPIRSHSASHSLNRAGISNVMEVLRNPVLLVLYLLLGKIDLNIVRIQSDFSIPVHLFTCCLFSLRTLRTIESIVMLITGRMYSEV